MLLLVPVPVESTATVLISIVIYVVRLTESTILIVVAAILVASTSSSSSTPASETGSVIVAIVSINGRDAECFLIHFPFLTPVDSVVDTFCSFHGFTTDVVEEGLSKKRRARIRSVFDGQDMG